MNKIISIEELAELLRDRWKLNALELNGVDNWTFYDISMSDYHADDYSDEELTKDYKDYDYFRRSSI